MPHFQTKAFSKRRLDLAYRFAQKKLRIQTRDRSSKQANSPRANRTGGPNNNMLKMRIGPAYLHTTHNTPVLRVIIRAANRSVQGQGHQTGTPSLQDRVHTETGTCHHHLHQIDQVRPSEEAHSDRMKT